MKNLRLIFEFFAENKVSTVIVVIIYTLVLFFANDSFGRYRYITYTRDLLQRTETPDSLYCMPSVNEYDMMISESDDPYGDFLDVIEEGAKKYKAYTPFSRTKSLSARFNGVNIDCNCFTPEMVEKYRLPLSSGSWLAMNKKSDGRCFNVITSGYLFDYLRVGDIAEIKVGKDFNLRFKIVGKLANPDIVPTYNAAGTNLDSNFLYQRLDGLIIMESDELEKAVKEAGTSWSTSTNFMTAYKSGSSQKEKDEYLKYFEDSFSVASYDKIMDESNKNVDYAMRNSIPIPVFMLVIVSIALLSVSVLLVNKMQREHSIYYLCGCNRARSCFIIACAITLLSAAGGLLNILFIAGYGFFESMGLLLENGKILFDGFSVLFTVLFALATALLSTMVSLMIFRKSSPIEIYRKYET